MMTYKLCGSLVYSCEGVELSFPRLYPSVEVHPEQVQKQASVEAYKTADHTYGAARGNKGVGRRFRLSSDVGKRDAIR
jgi:hypothetical protein